MNARKRISTLVTAATLVAITTWTGYVTIGLTWQLAISIPGTTAGRMAGMPTMRSGSSATALAQTVSSQLLVWVVSETWVGIHSLDRASCHGKPLYLRTLRSLRG